MQYLIFSWQRAQESIKSSDELSDLVCNKSKQKIFFSQKTEITVMTIPGNYDRSSVNDKHPKKKTESYKQFAENQAVAPWKMFVWKG